jgi:hypothetical protein
MLPILKEEAPKIEVPSILPTGEGTWKLGGIMKTD